MVVCYIKVYLLHIKRNEKLKSSLKKRLFDKVNINEENRGET